ncbi:PEP-CTERM sorting domain-containing protein [Haloferula sp. BvORR071]|uniref:PEP-CTERM sorting domain-containing protein n=1 Tax=Haloferula sp. BvORR071 TaxID=1396141 RepID=UPI00054D28F1|nr:PEP-CTERM sorting domain-containing protein [Haloferula sp. BvORR071]
MRSPLILAVAAAATATLWLSPSAHAQNPVYTLPGETGGSFTYLTVSQGSEYADSAHLAGTSRLLDDATLTLYSNVARQATVTLSFYAAVPAEFEVEGQPGVTPGALAAFQPADTPLWSSGPVVYILEGDGANNLNLNQLVFANINTVVPTDIFWSVQFSNVTNYTDGGAFGPKLENAANLGPTGAATDPSRIYLRDPGGEWFPVSLGTPAPPTSTLSLQLAAVPEPASALLLVVGAIVGLGRRRRVG